MATKPKKKVPKRKKIVRETPVKLPGLDILMPIWQSEVEKLQKEIQGLRFGQIIQDRKHETELMQARCPHRKPNARSAYNGQFDHQGTLHLVCAYCNHNVHIPKDKVLKIRENKIDYYLATEPAAVADKVKNEFDTFGGPEGSPAQVSQFPGVTFKELKQRGREEKLRRIELVGFDAEELSAEALEALIHAVENAKKFVNEGEQK